MNRSFFTNLPSEIIINILSRLQIRIIAICKCVCKPWLHLLETREFTDSHLSISIPGLVIGEYFKYFKIFDFEDKLDPEHHELRYNSVTDFDCREFITPPENASGILHGSVNGLIFLCPIDSKLQSLYICNPITREYIELSNDGVFLHSYRMFVTYGFGVSRMSGEYKVVQIMYECIRDFRTQMLQGITKSLCNVYTLGTGKWRSIAPGVVFEYDYPSFGAFVNGNLHWLIADLEGSLRISCFDLETEIFSTFSPPSLLGRETFTGSLVSLDGCLCTCDNTSDDEIVIWLMKVYGDEKSWRKEVVIGKIYDGAVANKSLDIVYPIKIFEDGDVLMSWNNSYLFYYSNKTKTSTQIEMFGVLDSGFMKAMRHSSSFLSLKSFPMENVSSF